MNSTFFIPVSRIKKHATSARILNDANRKTSGAKRLDPNLTASYQTHFADWTIGQLVSGDL